jgi:hypothetical protein
MTFTAQIFTKFCHSVEFCSRLRYRILCTSDEMCRKYGHNLIYARSVAPISSKLVSALRSYVVIVCVEFSTKRSVNLEITS